MMGTMGGPEMQDILAKNVRRFRKEGNLTQAQLAEKAGISTGYVSDIEGSRRWPSAEKLARLAEELDLAPFQLFLPTEDSPYFDRRRTLTMYRRLFREAFEKSSAEAFEKANRMFGASVIIPEPPPEERNPGTDD